MPARAQLTHIAKFTQKHAKEVAPLFRKRKGAHQNETHIVAAPAEAYDRGVYPEMAKSLGGMVEGTAQMEANRVGQSTFHYLSSPIAQSSIDALCAPLRSYITKSD
jgi:hypothetical protein